MTDTTRSLRAKLQHAERRALSTEEKLTSALDQITGLMDKAEEAQRDADYHRNLYERVSVERTSLKGQLEAASKADKELTERLNHTKAALRNVEAQRDRARAQAEAMRFQAFPIPPTFEWERPQSLEELQSFDPVTRMRRW